MSGTHLWERLTCRSATCLVVGRSPRARLLQRALQTAGFAASAPGTDPSPEASETDAVIIVGAAGATPCLQMADLAADCARLLPALRPGQLLVLEGRIAPGTTETAVAPLLRHHGLRPGADLHLACAPAPASAERGGEVSGGIRVVGGITAACTELAGELLRPIAACVLPLSSARAAEIACWVRDVLDCTDSAVAGEIALKSEALLVNAEEILSAAAAVGSGSRSALPDPTLPGPGRLNGVAAELLAAAEAVAARVTDRVAHAVEQALAQSGRDLHGARILVLGWPGASRHTGSGPDLAEALRLQGAEVRCHALLPEGVAALQPLRAEVLRESDCVVVLDSQMRYDLTFIARHAPVLVDARLTSPDHVLSGGGEGVVA